MGRKRLIPPAEPVGKDNLPETRCFQTNKRVFLSQEEADALLVEWAYDNHTEGRSYQCEYCRGWHITGKARHRGW